MTEPSHLTDSERLAAAMARVRGGEITEAQVRAHVMRSPHLDEPEDSTPFMKHPKS